MVTTAAGARSADQLRSLIQGGARPRYLLFWGHQPPATGGVGKGCLSQWWPAAFAVDGQAYPSAEHFMMAGKASLFGDAETAAKIREAPHPGAAKALGRQVRGFHEQRWAEHRFDLVVTGNLAKFSQHADLREFLLGAGDRVIAEASPQDRIWGIGLAAGDERAMSPGQWPGLNLLGFALMEVRHRLQAQGGTAVTGVLQDAAPGGLEDPPVECSAEPLDVRAEQPDQDRGEPNLVRHRRLCQRAQPARIPRTAQGRAIF
jgi:ribA/ribD-fused uncharacterized protein